MCYFSDVIVDMLGTHYLAMVNDGLCDVLTIRGDVEKAVAAVSMVIPVNFLNFAKIKGQQSYAHFSLFLNGRVGVISFGFVCWVDPH